MGKYLFKLPSVLLGLWFLIYPKPYTILFCILLIIPVFTIFLSIFQKSGYTGSDMLKEKKLGKYVYGLASAFNFITLVLGFRIFLDFNFEDASLIYYPIALAVVMIPLLIINRKNLIITRKVSQPLQMHKPKQGLLVMLGANIILLYLFVAAYGVNCVFDNTKPVIYNVEVLNKDISSYKSGKNYYLVVAPWGNLKSAKRVRVKENVYDSIKIKDIVPVNSRKGLFNMHWYDLPLNDN
ncbi:MAG: hypothetical protein IPJ81_11685 [Chitinophagaceae bacterium]|nr:hypothetical protein [Chitinophagaceae bacterium]